MNPKIQEGLAKLGFTSLTKPQEMALPILSSGQSCLIIAPTGFGKTEAALVPLFDWILSKKPEPVSVLYITPLKSLNRDLLDRMQFWDEHLGISIAVRHGDTTQSERRKQTLKKPDILITTPESFQGMLTSKSTLLNHIQWVIVDEIHELLDNKRGYQLAVGLERLKAVHPFTRIGLSATVRNPGLAADFLRGSDLFPQIVEFSNPKETQLLVESPKPSKEDIEFAQNNVLDPDVAARLGRIAQLSGSVLVFTNTREMAELLGARLNLLVPTKVHHSSLSRQSRITAERSFKSKEYKALVATSSMELGIDVGSIETVVQYTSPRQATRLIQRVGRSGHSWERVSKGIVLAGDALDILESAVIAKASLEKRLEPLSQEENPLDVLGHQIVGILLQRKTIEEAYQIIKGAQPFRKLTEAKFDEVVHFMSSLRLISPVSGRGNFTYYYSNLSTIPDSKKYDMKNIVDGHTFAQLDEEFVSSLDPGAVFICAGKFWQLVDTDPAEMTVLVEPAREAHHAPAWVGELIPVSKEISEEVIKLKNRLWDLSRASEADAVEYFMKDYPVTKVAAEKAVSWAKKAGWPEPAIETFKKFAFIHAPLGSRANEALGKLLAGFFSLRLGYSVGMKADQYQIMLEFPSPTDGAFIQKVLSSIKADHVEANLVTIMRHTPLFKHRFLHVAKRFGVISRDADLSKFGVDRLIDSFKGSPIEEEALKEIFTEKLDFETLVHSIQSLRGLPVHQGPSPMAVHMLESYAPELIGMKPESEILSALKTRLERRRFDLTCLYCKGWSGTGTPTSAPDKCPNCGSGLLGVVSKSSQGKSINLTADLYLSYGKKVLLALAGRGVGPETAKRILSRGRDETTLLKLILQAEKLYARTKRFWKE